MRRRTNTLKWPSFFGRSAVGLSETRATFTSGAPSAEVTRQAKRLVDLLPHEDKDVPGGLTSVAQVRISSLLGNTSKTRRTNPRTPRLIFSSCAPALTLVRVHSYTFLPPLFFVALHFVSRFAIRTFLFITTRPDDMPIPSCVCILALRQDTTRKLVIQ